ncbi:MULTISPECIES: hypothetical protein [unclassified Thioalkalivibrio]|uniref:hypothetical protein n=1 Tax=unclassified Thioalkalivibrio TaxID=2621013 RepID=UPI000361D43E|nr:MULTISPECIES: hypothetical protein [unclassified Thioalkalivibrio]
MNDGTNRPEEIIRTGEAFNLLVHLGDEYDNADNHLVATQDLNLTKEMNRYVLSLAESALDRGEDPCELDPFDAEEFIGFVNSLVRHGLAEHRNPRAIFLNDTDAPFGLSTIKSPEEAGRQVLEKRRQALNESACDAPSAPARPRPRI